MDHESIRAQYEAHLNELRRRPYSRENDEEEAACKRVIDALHALYLRTERTRTAAETTN